MYGLNAGGILNGRFFCEVHQIGTTPWLVDDIGPHSATSTASGGFLPAWGINSGFKYAIVEVLSRRATSDASAPVRPAGSRRALPTRERSRRGWADRSGRPRLPAFFSRAYLSRCRALSPITDPASRAFDQQIELGGARVSRTL